jgi:hypothetical protein
MKLEKAFVAVLETLSVAMTEANSTEVNFQPKTINSKKKIRCASRAREYFHHIAH